MGRILKILLYFVGAIVALLALAIVTFTLLFDPNDFRAAIEEGVQDATGREFVIEGDLDVSLFPWLAVEIGRTRLGNAEGFGDAPFARFDRARLSIRVMPLILRQEVAVGTAELEGLAINLAVASDGTSNWDDLMEAGGEDAAPGDAAPTEPAPGSGEAEMSASMSIGGVDVGNASLVYKDMSTGSEYRLTRLNIRTGPISSEAPVDIDASFSLAAEPAGVSADTEFSVQFAMNPGSLTLAGLDFGMTALGLAEAPVTLGVAAPLIALDLDQEIALPGEVAIEFMDVRFTADFEPFSIAGEPTPTARLAIDAFSPRSLMQTLAIELPPTADPNTFELFRFEGMAAVTPSQVRLDDMTLVFDDTTFTGGLIVPREEDGRFELDLAGDRIDITRYMSPADEGAAPAAGGEAVPVEIPVELIRSLNARGNLSLAEGRLGKLDFTNVELGINAGDGKIRLHPITAEFFDGRYEGDTRIDASGAETVMSVDERIEGVSLSPLAKAMAGRENVTGEINGRFVLSGRGNDLAQIQRTLSGNMQFELKDGAFEGTDVWWELRRARAMFRQEAPPEPTLPARTRFSEVSATGQVVNGVLKNNDLKALLPFIELTGQGAVNFVDASADYYLTARVLEKPELQDQATQEEIDDLTQIDIPLRITGPLAEPRIGVDFDKIVRDKVEEKVQEELQDALKKLFKN